MLKAARVHGRPTMVIAMMKAATTQPTAIQSAAEHDPQQVEQQRHDWHWRALRRGPSMRQTSVAAGRYRVRNGQCQDQKRQDERGQHYKRHARRRGKAPVANRTISSNSMAPMVATMIEDTMPLPM